MKKVKSIAKLIRPRTLVWFGISTCYGFGSIILNRIPPVQFLLLVLTIVFANIGAIIVNDIGDVAVDAKSSESSKRERPLVTGEISIKTAWLLAVIFFSISLFVSLLYGLAAIIFSIIIILFSLSYSLPPFKFCARPYSSIFYWVILSIVSYFLMIFSLENIDSGYSLKFSSVLFNSKQGWVFIGAIILFMGIAEILAKDLRDKINDTEGGRNTFVNFVGVELSVKILFFFAWFGFILWMEALYIAEVFPQRLSGILCFFVGLYWCIKIYRYGMKLKDEFEQSIAIKLHKEWTIAYLSMQVATFLSFMA